MHNVNCESHLNFKFFAQLNLTFLCFSVRQIQPWRGTQLSSALRLLEPFTKIGVQIKMHFVHFVIFLVSIIDKIGRIICKFQPTGSIGNVKTPVHAYPVRSAENISIVRDSVTEEPSPRRLRYREMITDFLWPEIEYMDLDNMWFLQDGATCHTANETMAPLREKFNGRVISCCGDV